MTVSTGIITTIAGTGTAGYTGDNGVATSATLKYPTGVAIDSTGMVIECIQRRIFTKFASYCHIR